MRATSEAILPILLYWLTTSESDIVGMKVKVSYQYSIKFRCPATDGSRKAVWHRTAYEPNVCNWISPCWKNGYHWHSSALAEHSWGPNKWMWAQCSGEFQHRWQQQQFAVLTGADLYESCVQALVHLRQKYLASGGKYAERYCFVAEFSLSNSVILLFVFVVVSLKINRRHYFQRDLFIKINWSSFEYLYVKPT